MKSHYYLIAIIIVVLYPYTLFFFLYLSIRPESLLSEWSYIWDKSGGIMFILVWKSTTVLINGHKDFDFQCLSSSKFPRHPHSWRNNNFKFRPLRRQDNSN